MNSQTKTASMTAHSVEIPHLHDVLEQQKRAYLRYPLPTAQERIDRLARLKRILVKYQDQFAEAINQDYGNRSVSETKIGELLTCLEHIKYYSRNLTQWMKPSKRHIGIIHQPAKAWVQYQPLGVIGIIAPWNYPLLLSVGPLICALAAGNHAMIKISSSSAAFGAVLEHALAEAFPQELVAVINGGGAISDAFCHLSGAGHFRAGRQVAGSGASIHRPAGCGGAPGGRQAVECRPNLRCAGLPVPAARQGAGVH